VLGVALVALLVWGGRLWLVPSNSQAAEITAAVTRAALPIDVTERGELESSKTIDVRCEVEGHQNKIVEITPEGTPVTKDQVVVRFDTELLTKNFAEQEIKLKQAEGKAKTAKGELEVQKNKAESEVAQKELALQLAELDKTKYLEGEYKVELEDKQGAIKLAERDLKEAEEKLEHYRAFVKKGFGTPEQLRLKETDVVRHQFNLARDKAKLMVLEKFTLQRQTAELTAKAAEAVRELERTKKSTAAAVDKAQSDLDAAEVTAKLEKATLERIKKQLDRCVVKAPQEGILVYSKDRYWDASSRIQLGAMVHFQQTLFSLPDLGRMQVKVHIHESVVKKVKPGQKADILVDAYPDRVLHGTVESVATLAHSRGYWDERAVKEYVTIVKIDDLPVDAGLKPGMTAEVTIHVKHLNDVLTVPVQAVTERAGGHCCYVVGPNGVERREVTVGENNDKFVEVKSGLEESERVALDARARGAAEAKESERKGGVPPKPTVPEATSPAVGMKPK
jgi:RND family efflux transporter MFP subunit